MAAVDETWLDGDGRLFGVQRPKWEVGLKCSSYACTRRKIITSVKWNELYCTCKIILGVYVSLVKVRKDKIRIRTPQ